MAPRNPPPLSWIWLPYQNLSLEQLYAALALRVEVFVVEQDCPYQECDGKDQQSFHLLGYEGTELVAVARAMPAGIAYAEASLGRVVVRASHRQRGLGIRLMQEVLQRMTTEFGPGPVRISAQEHLHAFYRDLGFTQVSKPYLEDGIPHVQMLKR